MQAPSADSLQYSQPLPFIPQIPSQLPQPLIVTQQSSVQIAPSPEPQSLSLSESHSTTPIPSISSSQTGVPLPRTAVASNTWSSSEVGGQIGGLIPTPEWNNPVTQQFASFGMNIAANQFTAATAKVSKLKYYFHVDNLYVLKKLRMLLLPCLHKKGFRRSLVTDLSSSGTANNNNNAQQQQKETDASLYKFPTEDENAPDLYIPLMSFITYVLLVAAIFGANGSFSPELIGLYASSTLVTLIFEVLIMEAGFYLHGADFSSPPLFDVVAYASYKYVLLIVAILIGLLFGGWAFFFAKLVTGCCMGLFLLRSFHAAITATSKEHLNGSLDISDSPEPKTRRNYFLFVLGFLQLLLTFFLLRSISF
eukprot:TRINITY_DN2874_c0_g1_i1.p1 TRINITY_DN2874_c0_g1~~TRINITY_DN2874_c0_g1_i1.p1  ORF type:complete len:365 (-),score=84.59 TRINITY_DN2874_c0_g1_i1:464-1558(-)